MATKKRYSDINKSHARYLFSLRKHLREIASNRRGRLIEKREVLIWQ